MAKVKNKRNSGLADKVHKNRKGDINKKKLNPFEVHINREKIKVLGKKSKHDRGLPGVSRAKAVQKRKETLGTEMKLMNKTNTFIDKRIGEKSAQMSAEDKMIARFAAERVRQQSKKSIYNLADDEILTHRGQTLEQIEKFDDPRSSDDEEEGGKKFGGLDDDFVSEGHFGGGMLSKVDKDGAKSHKDLIEQLIAESKKRKMEKQKEKEQTLDLTEKLDSEWKDLQPVVFKRARVEEKEGLIDKLLSENEKKNEDYDKMMRELKFDRRGTPSDGLKSDEKQEREERLKLEMLEKERMHRMLGDEAPKVQTTTVKHRSAEDLDDNFELDDEKEFMLAYDNEGKPLVPEHILKDYSVPNSKPKFEDGVSDTSSEEGDESDDKESEDGDSNDEETEMNKGQEKTIENENNKSKNVKLNGVEESGEDSDESEDEESKADGEKIEETTTKNNVKDIDTSKSSKEKRVEESEEDSGEESDDESEADDEENAQKPKNNLKDKSKSSKDDESEEDSNEESDNETTADTRDQKFKQTVQNSTINSDTKHKSVDNKNNQKKESNTVNTDKNSILFQNQNGDTSDENDESDESESEGSDEENDESEKVDDLKDLRESEEESDDESDEEVENYGKITCFDLKTGEGYDLKELLTGKTPSQQATTIQKLIKKYDPSLAENNKNELTLLYARMLQYINDIFTKVRNEGDLLKSFLIFDKMAPLFYDLAHTNKVSTKKLITELLKEKHDIYVKNMKKVPDLDTLIVFKLVSLLYPTSDYSHPVTTPSLTFMSEILANAKYNNAYSISRGLFLTSLVLEYISLSKRLVPTAINFIRGILFLSSNTTILNPVQIVPPFKLHNGKLLNLEDDCSKLEVEQKMAVRDLVLKEIDNDFKMRCFLIATLQLKEFFNHCNSMEAQQCIFEPHLKLFDRIDLELYPKKVVSIVKEVTQYMKQSLESKTFAPLTSEKKKPKALRLYEPDIQEVFTGSKSSKLSRSQAERARLRVRLRRETRGALRDLRRDTAYVAAVRLRQKIRSDNIRKEKVKQIYKDASIQQGELNKLKRMK